MIYNGGNRTGADTKDGFRIRWDPSSSIVNGHQSADGLIFEKTDANQDDPDGGMAFVNTGSDGIVEPALIIQGNGDIGIGTNPNKKLDVCGIIRSKEWVVETGFCDYVFYEDYERMSITEREQYYKKYHHLPWVQPSDTMQQRGMKVVATLKGVTRNVEEMSLYQIDIYKKVQQITSKSPPIHLKIILRCTTKWIKRPRLTWLLSITVGSR